MSNKKSQAALEFLTTYAWAFLVILIMVAALAYFGILSPSKLLPERCNFGSEIGCRDYKLDKTGQQILLRIANNVGETISVTNIATTNEAAVPLICSVSGSYSMAQGASQDFVLVNCPAAEWTGAGFNVNQKGKVQVTVTYNTALGGSTYPHQVQGEIFATVQ